MPSPKKTPKPALPKINALSEFIKNFWLPIAGFIGAVLLFVELFQKWNENSQRVIISFAFVGLAAVVLVLWWVAYRTKDQKFALTKKNQGKNINYLYKPVHRRWAKISLVTIVIALFLGLSVTTLIFQQRGQMTREKIIILLATLDGPEETYGFTNQLREELKIATQDIDDIEIISIPEIVSPNSQGDGYEYARELGKKYSADLIIWGWYRPIENPNITLHVENLSEDQFYVLKKSGTLQPVAKLADLENFSIQQKASGEITALVSFIAGVAYFQVNNYSAAISNFDQALSYTEWTELLVNAADAFVYRGLANYMDYNLEQSIKDYDQAINLQPEYFFAYVFRGAAHNDLKDYHQAISDYDKAIELDPSNTYAYSLRALAYYNLDQYDEAITNYSQAIQLAPSVSEHYDGRGLAYYGLADNGKAIADFSQSILLNPFLPSPYVNRGNSYDDLGQHDRAIADYNMAISLEPDSANSYFNRGLAYYRLSQYDRAIQDFDKAILLDPDYIDAYGSRGNAYDYLGQSRRALEDYNKAISLDPANPDIYYDRGLAYAALEQYDMAVADYSQAILLDPTYVDAYYYRSNAYLFLGDLAASAADQKRYHELTGQP